jgi:hypothetical protein
MAHHLCGLDPAKEKKAMGCLQFVRLEQTSGHDSQWMHLLQCIIEIDARICDNNHH